MKVSKVQLDRLEIGDIVLMRVDRNISVIGIYLGFLEKELKKVVDQKFELSMLSEGEDRIKTQSFRDLKTSCYMLEIVNTKDYNEYSDIEDLESLLYNYNKKEVLSFLTSISSSVFSYSFLSDRLYSHNYTCYYQLEVDDNFSEFTKDSINLWLLKSALQTGKREYEKAYSYNDLMIEIDEVVSKHFKELRKEEEEYLDYVTDCKLLDKTAQTGKVYLVSRKKGIKEIKVLMLSLGNGYFIQYGTCSQYKNAKGVLIKTLLREIEFTDFLTLVLQKHKMLRLKNEDKVYELNKEIMVAKKQRLAKTYRENLTKITCIGELLK